MVDIATRARTPPGAPMGVNVMTTPIAGRSGSGVIPAGPGARPPAQRRREGMSGHLRQVAWASVPLWSLSLLAFAPFLRIALARRRARDWFVFAGYLAAVIVTVILMSIAGPDDAASVAAGGLAMVVMGFAAVHAFVAFRPGQEAATGQDASELALTTARTRMHHRRQARELAAQNPVLARELGIGRPDVPHDYDDGGLVDVNHVPAGVLASCLALTPAESAAVVAARSQLGRFTSAEELSAYTELPPDRVETLRDWMLFG